MEIFEIKELIKTGLFWIFVISGAILVKCDQWEKATCAIAWAILIKVY